MGKPIPFYQMMIFLALGSALLVTATEVAKYHRYNPTVLNSLPASKVKCDDSAVKGWCAGKHMTVKQWEGMQK